MTYDTATAVPTEILLVKNEALMEVTLLTATVISTISFKLERIAHKIIFSGLLILMEYLFELCPFHEKTRLQVSCLAHRIGASRVSDLFCRLSCLA